MALPRVSVVIPTRNRPAVVSRAVTSALSQTFYDLEVIVVDDGSDDETEDVLRGLASSDDRLRVLRTTGGRGAPTARNHGIDAARAELVAFLDDDDEWLPDKIALQVGELDDDPGLTLIGCHHEEVTSRGAAAYVGPRTWHPHALLWCNFLGSASFVVARRPPRFDPELEACQDWDLWVRSIAKGGTARVIPEVLVRYSAEGSDRITESSARRLAGHARFAMNHSAEMSSSCRAYHRARQRLLRARTAPGHALAAAAIVATTPPPISSLLAREIAAARAGARMGDPGRGMRTLGRLLEGRV